MNYYFNYELNNRYSSLDMSVFYLVSLESSIQKFFEVFFLFSKERVAKSIEKLHNNQLISVNIDLGNVTYSSQIKKLNQTIEEKVKFEINSEFPETFYLDSRKKEDSALIHTILEKIHFDYGFHNLNKSINLIFHCV